jgi:hypothetical protein
MSPPLVRNNDAKGTRTESSGVHCRSAQGFCVYARTTAVPLLGGSTPPGDN